MQYFSASVYYFIFYAFIDLYVSFKYGDKFPSEIDIVLFINNFLLHWSMTRGNLMLRLYKSIQTEKYNKLQWNDN